VFFSLAENNWVNIKAGRSKTKMIGMAASNFPALPVFPAAGIEVPIPMFSALIQKTIFAVSDQESRYTLGGTQFEICAVAVAGRPARQRVNSAIPWAERSSKSAPRVWRWLPRMGTGLAI
jgi:hypothetical protein